jgi:hypothetical protein
MNSIQRKSWLAFILFGLLAISILTPIGSIFSPYENIPKNDFRDHVAATVQAKMALDEGQFPIRVTPYQHEGLRYAEFQFYGVLPYTLSGFIYKILTHSHSVILNNPFNTLKLVLWMAITLCGVYAYRFARLFTDSDVIAFLAAIAYVFSPYLIVNIDYRGDYTEALAQTILPIVLFYSFKLIYSASYRFSDFIFASMAWAALLTTHLITFAYCALIFVIAAALFFIFKLSEFKRVVYMGFSMLTALALVAWFIAPIILYSGSIAVGGEFDGVHTGAGLKPTSLFNLLALKAGPAEEVAPSWPWFYASIGWPMLFGFLSCFYLLIQNKIARNTQQYRLMLVISFLSLMTFVMVWSCFNIWHFLPYFFSVAEWSYRLLSQLMWLGIILFVLAAENIFGKDLQAKHLIVGIFVITFATSSWISKPPEGIMAASLIKNPDLLFADAGYLPRAEKLKPYPGLDKYGFVQIPLVTMDSKILLNHSVSLPANLFQPTTILVLKGNTLKQAQNGNLVIKLDDKIIATKTVTANQKFNWSVPVGEFYTSHNKFHSLVVDQVLAANEINHTPAYFNKLFPMVVDQFVLTTRSAKKLSILPIEKIKPGCTKIKDSMECHIHVTSEQAAAQLPSLYYPNMLTVTVDGKKSPYEATFYRNADAIAHYDSLHSWNPKILATVVLPKGDHVVTVKTTGLHWANMIAITAWMILALVGIFDLVRSYRSRFNANK